MTNYGWRRMHEQAIELTKDFTTHVSHGDIPTARRWQTMGSTVAGSGVTKDVWPGAGIYVFPPVPTAMEIVSGSVQDTADGTGIRTVCIDYVDGDGEAGRTNVTMNGTTPVVIPDVEMLAVNCFRARTVGSSGAAVGSITIRPVGGGTTYGIILAGQNAANNVAFMVPKGERLSVIESSYAIGGVPDVEVTIPDIDCTVARLE